MGDDLHPTAQKKAGRPLGLSGIIIMDVLFLLYKTMEQSSMIHNLPFEFQYLRPKWIFWLRILFVFAALVTISGFFAWIGSKRGRTFLFLFLTIFFLPMFYEYLYTEYYMFQEKMELSFFFQWSTIWYTSWGIRLALWLGLNYWYLFGSQGLR